MPSLNNSPPVDASTSARGFVNLVAQSFEGVKTFARRIVASLGVNAGAAMLELSSDLGGGVSDLVTKLGTTVTDASVSASAKLLTVRTGIGGTEVEKVFFDKAGGLTFWGAAARIIKWDAGGGNSWQIEATPGSGNLRFGNNASTYLACRFGDGFTESAFGFDVAPSGSSAIKLTGSTGRIDQLGTNSSGTPGAATINRATGVSAIANGATTVTITNSAAFATSRVMITWHDDHGAARFWVVRANGSFTVTLSSAATANASFSWQVSSLL